MTNEITVYAESYGCTSNRHDLEIMLGILEQSGYRIVTDPSKADVIIINTCAVKEPTQKRMLHRIASIRGKPLIISGCLPKIDLEAIKQVAPDYSAVLDPQSIHRISSVVEQASRSIRNLQYFSVNPPPKPTLPKKRLNPYVEIIQIAEGCLGDCSYCCTKHARGKLHSFPKTSIIERVKNAVSNGAREIWLTAQDTGAYGIDHETNLSALMREITKLDGDFRIRLGMMNPNHAATMIDDLCEIIRDAKTYKFLHIPVQSGSEKILRHMKRQYEPEEFKRLVRRLRSRIPNLTLSTDIIVGYPTETDEDFQSTIDLITETRPDITNISKYGPRPRTEASQTNPPTSKHLERKIQNNYVPRLEDKPRTQSTNDRQKRRDHSSRHDFQRKIDRKNTQLQENHNRRKDSTWHQDTDQSYQSFPKTSRSRSPRPTHARSMPPSRMYS